MNSICYLCGKKLAEETKDHVFPKCLFPPPLPHNLPTAPSCEECNNSLSKDEEYFRFYVASGNAYEIPSGHRIWTERIRPSLRENRRGFKTLLQKCISEVRVNSSQGISYVEAIALDLDRERIHSVLRKIAKGLYYLNTNKPLPNNIKIHFKDDNRDIQTLITPPFDKAIQGAKRTDLGQDVVTYYRNTVMDDPTNSMTWLVFYRVKAFLILTCSEDLIQNR